MMLRVTLWLYAVLFAVSLILEAPVPLAIAP